MDEIIKRCDRCTRKDAVPFMVVRKIGGEEVQIDLCSACTALLMRRVITALTPEQQTRITREVLAYRKEATDAKA